MQKTDGTTKGLIAFFGSLRNWQPKNAPDPRDRTERPEAIRRTADNIPFVQTPSLKALRWSVVVLATALSACSNGSNTARDVLAFPTVELKPSEVPTYAVGDRFTYNNPRETWTVTVIDAGLVTWRSSRGASKQTVFDPMLPPVTSSDGKGDDTTEHLVAWGKTLFPLSSGKRTAFKTIRREKGAAAGTEFIWKCYSGNPRNVTVSAGTFPAYPVQCRRSDGFTVRVFHAPEVNGPVLITTRKRPSAGKTRELISYAPGPGARIAATSDGGLPKGWAVAAVAKPGANKAPHKTGAGTQSADTSNSRRRRPTSQSPAQTENGSKTNGILGTKAEKSAQSGQAKIVVAPVRRAKTRSRQVHGQGSVDTFGVQIASYRRIKNATLGWSQFVKRLSPLLNNAKPFIQRVDLGNAKGVFHRLHASRFNKRADAQALCRSLRQRGAECIVNSLSSNDTLSVWPRRPGALSR